MYKRQVVDRQLQKAIMGMEHKAGLIRVMDDKCVSADPVSYTHLSRKSERRKQIRRRYKASLWKVSI